MTDLELVIGRCKQLEALLEQGLRAKGRGLHEKVTSVERRLPVALVKKLRFVATVRNKLVHEPNYNRLDDRDGFVRACDAAEQQLQRTIKNAGKGCLGVLLAAGVGLALFALALVALWGVW